MSAQLAARIFELTAGNPALDLVNTLDWRFRDGAKDEFLSTYDDLLAFCEQNSLIGAKQARQLRQETRSEDAARMVRYSRALREALAEVLYAQLDSRPPAAAALKSLQQFFKAAQDRQQLIRGGSGFSWRFSSAKKQSELPLWLLTRSASDLLFSRDLEHLRACGDPECRWLFLDTSKNHTRRWCNMSVCGNRMKARRFKAQRKA